MPLGLIRILAPQFFSFFEDCGDSSTISAYPGAKPITGFNTIFETDRLNRKIN